MADAVKARIAALYRYPVKGLTPERLPAVELSVGRPVPFDRAYAIENGPSGFDPADPVHLPKIKFLMLMKQERLAALRTAFDDRAATLTIYENGVPAVAACLETAEGRAAVERFFAERFAEELRGPPKVLKSHGFSFSDVPEKCISIINLASVRDLEQRLGVPVDPLRFRANVYVEGLPAWSEFDLVGARLGAGTASLSVFARIRRCAATNVDPVSGVRDLEIPGALQRCYGHMDCGIYATVRRAGRIAEGDGLAAEADIAPAGPAF